MKLKNLMKKAAPYILSGGLALSTGLKGYSQDISSSTIDSLIESREKEYSAIVDSVMSEAEKYPTTTHFMYEIMKGSKFNFHNTKKLEKIINKVEEQHEKKEDYSKEEVIDILETTDKAIKKYGPKLSPHEFDCDDVSRIYLAIGEKFDLPLHGVQTILVEGKGFGSGGLHFFVRYDPNGKHNFDNQNDSINNGDFNWEGTVGEIKPDSFYYSLPEKCLRKFNPHYMQSLTKKQVIGHAYGQKGLSLMMEGKRSASIYGNIADKLGDISFITPAYYKCEEIYGKIGHKIK